MIITDHPFGEFVEACLAINLGYLALERFRYREAIKRIMAAAESHLQGMPEAYREDKAWKDLSGIRERGGPDTQILHFVYHWIFDFKLDRGIALMAAIIAFTTLVGRALYPTFATVWDSFPDWGDWLLFLFLLLTTALSAILIQVGQRCVHRVALIITENVGHLAKRYVNENKSAADQMVEFINELKQNH